MFNVEVLKKTAMGRLAWMGKDLGAIGLIPLAVIGLVAFGLNVFVALKANWFWPTLLSPGFAGAIVGSVLASRRSSSGR